MRVRGAAALLLAALAVAGAGCGGDDQGGQRAATTVAPASPTTTAATAPAASTPATDTTPVATPETTTVTTPTATTGVPPTGGTQAPSGEGPGGSQAGDEEAIRVPVQLTVDGSAIYPPQVTIPAFLPIELVVTARNAGHRVVVRTPSGEKVLDVAGGGRARRSIPGLKPGDYAVVADGGKARATLHVINGGAPGP